MLTVESRDESIDRSDPFAECANPSLPTQTRKRALKWLLGNAMGLAVSQRDVITLFIRCDLHHVGGHEW